MRVGCMMINFSTRIKLSFILIPAWISLFLWIRACTDILTMISVGQHKISVREHGIAVKVWII